jgi:AcrR family transcriptional regulator
MFIPARILRADVIAREPALADMNQRERLQHERILRHAPALFARYGRQAISFRNFAVALKMAPATLRKHFADLDALFAAILTTHLMAVATAIGDGPPDPAARRATYLAATRAPFGGLTEAHFLLVHERQLLPPDLREGVEALHQQLGALCAPIQAPPLSTPHLATKPLALLDCPAYEAAEIEQSLRWVTAPQCADPPKPPAAPVRLAAVPSVRNPYENDEGMDTLSLISGVTVPFGGLGGPGGGRPAYAAEPATGHA